MADEKNLQYTKEHLHQQVIIQKGGVSRYFEKHCSLGDRQEKYKIIRAQLFCVEHLTVKKGTVT